MNKERLISRALHLFQTLQLKFVYLGIKKAPEAS